MFKLLSLTLVFILFTSCQHTVSTKKDLPDFSQRRTPNQIESPKTCDKYYVAEKINSRLLKGPKILYHFGSLSVLQEDIDSNQIPENAWTNYIMGEKTQWQLKRFRRGLYGTENPEQAEKFATTKNDPWVIKLTLSDACIQPENLYTTDIQNDPRFKFWYERKFKQPVTWAYDQCLNNSAQSFTFEELKVDWYSKNKTDSSYENACEILLNDYFTDMNAKLIQDPEVSQSWYIRDRQCISAIHGDTETVLNLYTQRKPWINACQISVTGADRLRVISHALVKKTVDAETVHILKRHFNSYPFDNAQMNLRGLEMISAFERCSSEKKISTFDQARKDFDAELINYRVQSSAFGDEPSSSPYSEICN